MPSLSLFQINHSYQSTNKHFNFCQSMNRLPYPMTFLLLITFSNLFLVFNSSINFIIYCAVRKSFRQKIISILKSPFVKLKTVINNIRTRSDSTMDCEMEIIAAWKNNLKHLSATNNSAGSRSAATGQVS